MLCSRRFSTLYRGGTVVQFAQVWLVINRGEEAPLGWGVENRHCYVALTRIHCYRIETIVDS